MAEKPKTHRTAGERPEPPPLPPSSDNGPGNGGSVDGDLFKNLIEMVPLVESLMDRKANPSFKRRASMVYTPAPPSSMKAVGTKGKKTDQTVSAKKERDNGKDVPDNHTDNQDSVVDNFRIFSSRAMTEDVQKDMEELTMLQEQLADLHKKIVEKDEALKSAEDWMNQLRSLYGTLDELRRQVVEKDFLVKSAKLHLSDTEIKLAERQASLERLDQVARTYNQKVEKLQKDLDSMDFEITAFMHLFQELSRNDSTAYSEENITSFRHFDELPHIDDISETQMEKMEAARSAYIKALAAAKDNPSDESLLATAEARQRLEAFVF